MADDIVDYARQLQQLTESGRAFVTVTLVDIRGSAPQILGAKTIVTDNGIEWGTVGGGKIEAAAVRHAQQMLSTGTRHPELKVWNLQTDIGMTCGGEVKLFFEVHARSQWPIAVYGAGHVAQELIRLLVQLDCHVTCIDSREAWLDRLPTHNRLTTVCVAEPKTTVADLSDATFFVLMSKGHATDLPVLAEILSTREPPYLGVIGSKQKASVLRRDLAAQGIPAERLDAFFCPLGLPIGNNTPAEIAISVAAQLLEQRDHAGPIAES